MKEQIKAWLQGLGESNWRVFERAVEKQAAVRAHYGQMHFFCDGQLVSD